MIPFKQFILLERQNYFSPHLSHLEDLAIENGKEGYSTFAAQVNQIASKVKGFESETEINAKIDGSPAIIFGLDPRKDFDTQFFVGLKYAIDEATDSIKPGAKLIHSVAEADSLYGNEPSLADKLKSLYNALKDAYDNSGKIYQGDVLYASKKEKSVVSIGNELYTSFKPNVILYTVPVDKASELYNNINNSDVGVIVHDSFTTIGTKLVPAGKNVSSLIASSKNTSAFIRGSNYGETSFDIPDNFFEQLNASISAAQSNINKISDKFDAEYKAGKILPMLKIFINKEVDKPKAGLFGQAAAGGALDVDKMLSEFKIFISARMLKGVDTLKEKGAQARQQAVANMEKYINTNGNNLKYLFAATFEMTKIKYLILNVLNQLDTRLTQTAFFQNPDGTYVKTGDEGYVLFVGNNQVKLVDRVNFTKMNRAQGGRHAR